MPMAVQTGDYDDVAAGVEGGEETGEKVMFKVDINPDDVAIVRKCKQILGMNVKAVDFEKWVGSLEAMTTQATEGCYNDGVSAELTKDTFHLWAKFRAGKCSKAKPHGSGTESEHDRGAKLHADKVFDLMCVAFTASIAWSEGIDWLQKASVKIEVRMLRLPGQCTRVAYVACVRACVCVSEVTFVHGP